MDRNIYKALHKAVHKAPSGLSCEQIADSLEINTNTLTYQVNPLYPERRFGVEYLARLMMLTQDFTPLHLVAQECGHAAIRLPATDRAPHAVHSECMKSVQVFGELMAQCSQALEDGRISLEESDKLVDSGHAALRGILTLLQSIQKEAR